MAKETVRELILSNIKTIFDDMVDGVDEYTITWSKVTRGVEPEDVKRKNFAISIFDEEEAKDPRVQYMDVRMRILLQFNVYLPKGINASIFLNDVLGQVQRRMREDFSRGGFALETDELGNELFLDHERDRKLEGTVFYSIRYQHHIDDPRKTASNVFANP